MALTLKQMIANAVERKLITYHYATKPSTTTFHVFEEHLKNGGSRSHRMSERQFTFYLNDLIRNARKMGD